MISSLRRPAGAACREAEDALLLGAASDDATTRVRIDRHVGRCPNCLAVQHRCSTSEPTSGPRGRRWTTFAARVCWLVWCQPWTSRRRV